MALYYNLTSGIALWQKLHWLLWYIVFPYNFQDCLPYLWRMPLGSWQRLQQTHTLILVGWPSLEYVFFWPMSWEVSPSSSVFLISFFLYHDKSQTCQALLSICGWKTQFVQSLQVDKFLWVLLLLFWFEVFICLFVVVLAKHRFVEEANLLLI